MAKMMAPLLLPLLFRSCCAAASHSGILAVPSARVRCGPAPWARFEPGLDWTQEEEERKIVVVRETGDHFPIAVLRNISVDLSLDFLEFDGQRWKTCKFTLSDPRTTSTAAHINK